MVKRSRRPAGAADGGRTDLRKFDGACLPRFSSLSAWAGEGRFVAAVTIGIDPHKDSHTAVAVSAGEKQLGGLRVCARQASRHGSWQSGAAAWPERT